LRILQIVEPTLLPTDLDGAPEEELAARSGSITRAGEGHRRIAHCECGAQLVGQSDADLFAAVQQHLAHHHPQLLGALEPDVVCQMAEDVGLGTPAGARGQRT
jgi:hypothetical protein